MLHQSKFCIEVSSIETGHPMTNGVLAFRYLKYTNHGQRGNHVSPVQSDSLAAFIHVAFANIR